MIPFTPADAKIAARAIRAATAPHVDLGHGQSLDLLARILGFDDWNALSAQYAEPATSAAMPILRIYDRDLARRFYVDGLGFSVESEHRFDPALPLFMIVRRDETVLALSEHHGDGTPGSAIWIPTRHLARYRAAILTELDGQRPGIDSGAPGGPTMTVVDPFGNELRFCEPTDS